MVYVKPGEQMRMIFFQSVTQAYYYLKVTFCSSEPFWLPADVGLLAVHSSE